MPLLVIVSVIVAFLAGSAVGPVVAHTLLEVIKLPLSQTSIALVYGAIVYLVTIALLWLCVRYVFRAPYERLGIAAPKKWLYIALLPVIFVGYYAVSIGFSAVLSLLFPALHQSAGQQLGFTPESTLDLVLGGVLLIVVAPLAEEFIFRGYLFGLLRGKASFVGSAIVTSLLFGAAHVFTLSGSQPLWLLGADTFILSLVLCWLRERTGSIWAGVGLHALKNSLAFVLLFIVKVSM